MNIITWTLAGPLIGSRGPTCGPRFVFRNQTQLRISTTEPKRGDVKRIAIPAEIYAAQVQALYQHIPMVLIVDVVNAALVSIVLSSYLRQTLWLAFLTLTVALTGARAFGWACYCHSPQALKSASKWAIAATLGSGLSGLLWGAGSALLLSDNLVEQTFVAFVIGGISIASLVAFSNYLLAFIAYVLPASLPVAGRLFLDGWTVHGDMMVVFAAAITLVAWNSSRDFAKGLLLNLELREKSDQLAAANIRLELEIEQRQASEDQLRQAHKMEAVGQLTGGIAHDFNNLLTAVIGHLEMAETRVSDCPRTTGLVQAALRAAERGAALTRHLLAFGRRQHLEPRSIEIPGLIDSAVEILKQTIGPEIRVVTRSEPDLPPARADPNQLALAILNLALNGRDAMRDGGTLCIEARKHGEDCDLLPPGLSLRDYVIVSVSDTGSGMNGETLQRAFEPFFTTKEVGRGSGLGLSIVHGFAAQSGGSVQISSVLGKGTKVDLWLPCAETEPIKCAGMEPDQSIMEPRQARILVCDDDPDVLGLVGTFLREDGCTVLEAETPLKALEMIETEPPFDLLLVDYAMPQMNGVAVIDRARAHQQDMKVLLMSGHADVPHARTTSGTPLIAKPFKTAELRRRIKEILFVTPSALGSEHSSSRNFAVS
jgi:signal transduction histidine kinase/CheY-like chemotaxis protein